MKTCKNYHLIMSLFSILTTCVVDVSFCYCWESSSDAILFFDIVLYAWLCSDIPKYRPSEFHHWQPFSVLMLYNYAYLSSYIHIFSYIIDFIRIFLLILGSKYTLRLLEIESKSFTKTRRIPVRYLLSLLKYMYTSVIQ